MASSSNRQQITYQRTILYPDEEILPDLPAEVICKIVDILAATGDHHELLFSARHVIRSENLGYLRAFQVAFEIPHSIANTWHTTILNHINSSFTSCLRTLGLLGPPGYTIRNAFLDDEGNTYWEDDYRN